MLTVLLWILLMLAAAALAAVSSPIRFGAAGSFGKSRRASGRFWLSYIHPALFAYEYSSTGRKERAVIFGINPKWFRWIKRKRKNIDNSDSIDDININTENNVNASNNANIGNNSIDNDYSISDINNDNNDDDDTLMARMARRVENIKSGQTYTKTVDGLNDIKSGGFYRHLKDKALRKKIFKWLKRALRCAVTTVRFDRLELRAAAGFKDPAQTGKMYGYFIAAKDALTPRNKHVNMELKPVFTEERLEADINFACRTSIAIITSHALILALTFPYRLTRKPKKHNKT
jgi:hypothetical protein